MSAFQSRPYPHSRNPNRDARVVERLSTLPFENLMMTSKKPAFITPKFEREYDYQSTEVEDEWAEIAKAKADLKRRENEIARLTETLSVDGTSSACSTISSRSNKASSMGGLGMASSAALSTSTQPVVVQPVRKVDTGGGMWGFDAPSNLPMLMPTGEIVYPRKARPKPPRSERIRKEKEEAEKRERDRSLQEQFRMNTKTREMNDAKALHDLERAAIGRQREEMARDAERIDVVQSEQARVRSKSLTGDPFKQLHSHQNNLHKSKSTPAQQSQHEKFKTYPIPEPTFAFDDGISLADTKCASSFHVSGLKKLFRK